MEYLVSYDTNVGIKKAHNEDSLLLKLADTLVGKIVFAVVCDGMGGLTRGELASKEVIMCLDEWFRTELPDLIKRDFFSEELFEQWDRVIQKINRDLYEYGSSKGAQLGTTVTGVLMASGKYYVLHVGDTRLYKINQQISCLTQDHSFVQREIANGRMTEEEARKDPRKNLLLQAVGTDHRISVDFLKGDIEQGDVFLLCSDGFRNKIYDEEILQQFQMNGCMDETCIHRSLQTLIEENIKRQEKDNITAIAIRPYND